MAMPTNTIPNPPKLNRRIAPTVARAIVRLWPQQTRAWGQAFAAELPAAESTGATIPWLIGGLTVMLREWCKHAWRSFFRPIGANPNAGESAGAFTQRYSRTPRMPLWLMLALTFSSAVILLHPEVRQSLRKLRSEYSRSKWRPEQWSSVKELRAISKSNRDPQLLALLSMLSDNDEERLRLSDEAIRKDPSLTWLDYEQSLLPLNDFNNQKCLPQERLERLRKWDPENSVPHLLVAEIIAKPARTDAFDALMRGKTVPAWEQGLASNSLWTSEMHAAFTAPKYDSYTSQGIELVRTVSSRFSIHDPEIALYVLTTRRVMQFDLLRGYAAVLMDRAAALQATGDTNEAIATYTEILHFTQRMSLDGKGPSEQYFGQEIGEKAAIKLVPLYDSLDRTEEASLVRFQLEKWTAEHDPKIMRYVPLHYRQSQWNSLAWSGLIIHSAALVLLIVFPITSIALTFIFRRRWTPLAQRGLSDFWASICADSAPWLLFASSVLLYLTYHPYAKLCSAFLKGGDGSPNIETFVAASMVPNVVPDYAELIYDPYSQWVGITVALCLLLTFFFWRMILRSKSAA